MIRIKRFTTYDLAESFVPDRGQPVYVFDIHGFYIGDGTLAVSGLTNLTSDVGDHGLLAGLADDDHTQYYNSARLTTVLDDYPTEAELNSALANYSEISHTHSELAQLQSDINTVSGLLSLYQLIENNNLYETEAISTVSNISLVGPEIKTITLSGNVSFDFTDIEVGRSLTIFVEGDSVERTVDFATGIRFSGPIPTVLAANKFGVLSVVALGTTVSGIRAIWAVEE